MKIKDKDRQIILTKIAGIILGTDSRDCLTISYRIVEMLEDYNDTSERN